MEETEKEGKGGGRDSEVVQQEQKRSALQDQHGNKKHCLSITILIQAVWMSVCMCVIIDFCVCACDVLGMYDFFLSLYPCICAYAFVNQRVSLPLHLCVHAHIGRGLRKRFHCICP